MAGNLPTIAAFEPGSNPSEAWRHWKQDFEDYVEALKYSNEAERTKTALFRHVCGEELKKQFRAFDLKPESESSEVTLTQILQEFDKYFQDYVNEIYASFKFLEIKQNREEKFADYYSRLRCAVIECGYGALTDRMLRDKIVQGLADKSLQERLIRETSRKKKTLQDIIADCKTAEFSRVQAAEMCDQVRNLEVIRVKDSGAHIRKGDFLCRYCGKIHERRKCPAYGTTCRKCNGINHWSKVCRAKVNKSQHERRVNALEQASDSDTEIVYLGELKYVNQMTSEKSNSSWFQKVTANGHDILFKLDTGAQVNVIPKDEMIKWYNQPVVKKCKQSVLDYSDNAVPILGECLLDCKTLKKNIMCKFLVTSLNSSPILGLEACEKLGLIQRLDTVTKPMNNPFHVTPNELVKQFSDVFTGIGRLNHIVKIKLKDNYTPHIAAPRKIPLALHDKVKHELQCMTQMGIIKKVHEPTEWVNNIVVINTPKKLRICLDPRPLNEAILRPHYPIPSADSLITQLQGSKVFTILDAKNGFWQLPLDEESSYLTTFTTPWGRYRFLVLPFGLNNAPEEFQRAMEEIFEDMPEVSPYFDDIALGSPSIESHSQLLYKVLSRARKANLKFNIAKTQLSMSSVNYLGHVLSDKGIKPDPRKVKAITEFPVPKCREDLQRFLGMITYLAKFTSHLSNLTHSLRQLLKQDSQWLWDENIQRDFELIKKALVQAPCLQYFEKNKALTVSVDASRNGLGAVLMQDNRPIAYGSASLNETQQRYAQIEKELLAVIYGLEHFNYYTYGRSVIVQTDHKPLLGLSKKQYDVISPRLQRMLLRLNRYDFKLEYVPGKLLLIADTLSRAQSAEKNFVDDEDTQVSVKINLLTHATPAKWKEYSMLILNDNELQDVLHHIQNGWVDRKNTRAAAQLYWHCKDELYCTDEGIICRGQRLVVPKAARTDILHKVHVTHRGVISCKAKAREYFYWPSMNSDIENFISKCKICQQHQRNNQKEILIPQDVPERPWKKVGCDFFQLKGHQYIIMIDYFSKYVEVEPIKTNNAQNVITIFKSIFARHGIPEEFVSDGGPPFNSASVKYFFNEWNIMHQVTSPHFPRANGQVERAIQTLKNSLIKAEQDGEDLFMVLLDYRIQPSHDIPSPAELLMGRRLRSLLPSHPEKLIPNFPLAEVHKLLKKRQSVQVKYGNRHGTEHSILQNNARVWFRQKLNEPWKQGNVIQTDPQSRSYIIKGKDGGVYRRNRFYIRPDKTESDLMPNTRSVEDFFPLNQDSDATIEKNNTGTSEDQPVTLNPQNKQTVKAETTIRKSTRKITKPLRYQDV